MIAAPTRSFSFPTPGQVSASRGLREGDPAQEAQAVKEAIARGYAEGLAQGRRAGEAEGRNVVETARKDGFEAGRKEAFVQVDQAAAALREALVEFAGERSEMACRAESFCVDLVLAVASRLVESDEVRAQFASRLVTKAVEVLAPEPPQAIYLNPADRALIGDALDGLPLKDDSSLAPGRTRVEAGRLVVEGGIDQAFEQIRSAVLDVRERRTSRSSRE